MRIIKNGDKINTMIGYLEILEENNSGLIYVDEYEIAECGYPIKIEKRLLTIHELELEAKTFDGKNHKFIYQ